MDIPSGEFTVFREKALSNIILAFRRRTAFAPHSVSDIGSTSFPCPLTTLKPSLQCLPSASVDHRSIIVGLEHVRHIESRLQRWELGFGGWDHGVSTL